MPGETKPGRNLIKGATGDWEIVIGLEVHAQVTSKAKLFSGASTAFGAAPNSHVRLVDAAMPGMLPVINEACVEQAVRTGLGLKAQINLVSVLRPQELLLSRPAAGLSDLAVQAADRRRGRGRGRRARRRQTRSRSASSGCTWSRTPASRCTTSIPSLTYVDLNRSGVALMEIVSQARHALGQGGAGLCHQAAHDPALSRHLRRQHGEGQPARRRQRLGAQARRRRSARAARSRTSTRSASSARRSSTRRAARSTSSRTAARSTRRRGCSMPPRARRAPCARKEEAHDYRYFPDPDLLPLELDAGLGRGDSQTDAAGTARRQEGALHRRLRALRLRRRRAGGASSESADYFEAVAQGRDAQARRQLGDQRAVRPAQQGRPGASPRAPCRPSSWAASST